MFLAGLLRMTELGEAETDRLLAAVLPELAGTVRLTRRQVNRIGGWFADVSLPHQHEHRTLEDILGIIAGSGMDDEPKRLASDTFTLLAKAEAAVHGMKPEAVRFHEVGALDALADVLCVCALMDALQPQRVLCSPINVGSGQVRCAHGVLPVPAPATERLLRGVPVYAGSVTGELCTPTGAALLRQFVSDYGAMPQMCVSAAGYGTGKKNFAAANVVRVLLGESGNGDEQVVELCCNIDDQPAESLAFAMDELLALGALDVYFTAVGMKKGRPGVLLTCLCRPEQRDAMLRCIFRNTTTLGVRERTCARYSLARRTQTVQTRFGPVRVKTAQGYGVTREKAEYDDLAQRARESGQPLDEIRAAVAQALRDRSEIDIPQT